MSTIVSFRKVDDFDALSEEVATKILYDELVPACEAKEVKLSSYGNHAGSGSIVSVEKYSQDKANQELFNVKRVQKAYSAIPLITANASQYKSGSYGLKHYFERHPYQSEYITNGDLIAAMLVYGHKARFGTSNCENVNCDFMVKANT